MDKLASTIDNLCVFRLQRWKRASSASKLMIGIIGASVALRVLSAVVQGDAVAALPGIQDQISYDALARRVLSGHGFTFAVNWWPFTKAGQPTAHWSFLYTLYLTSVYSAFGLHPLVARLIQAVVAGVLHPWLTYRIGSRVWGTSVGVMAAGLVAVYTYFIYYSGALMTETFYILAILWAIDLATVILCNHRAAIEASRFGEAKTPKLIRTWLQLGLAFGSAVLLRQLVSLFLPVLAVWLFWAIGRPRKVGERRIRLDRSYSLLLGLLISGIVVVAMVLPWTVRNYQVFGRLVPLNTNTGYAFFWSNHPIYGTSFVPILPQGVYQSLVPTALRGMDEASIDQALLREGLRFVIEDPVRWARLSLSRISVYFEFLPSSESGFTSNLARIFSFGICLPFVLYGLYVSVIRYRQYLPTDRRSMVVLMYLFVIVYTLIHLLSWALIRYRLPVDALLLFFAAMALTDLTKRLAKHYPRLVPQGFSASASPTQTRHNESQVLAPVCSDSDVTALKT